MHTFEKQCKCAFLEHVIMLEQRNVKVDERVITNWEQAISISR